MFRKRFYYIIQLQYLGFRYHGWQKQPDVLTVERMVQRTLRYVLERDNFKVLAAGRTDAKVSVNKTYVELFVDEHPLQLSGFLDLFNKNLPQDIRALEILETNKDFNIIQHKKQKKYLYLFSQGEKNHPFCAPFMINILETLDIPLMQQAARLMQGTHDFVNFTYKPSGETQTVVTVDHCEIKRNTYYTTNFFPEESYALCVKANGFKRHQVRLMMGALIELGRGTMEWDYFVKALEAKEEIKLTYIAQASGLILQDMNFEGESFLPDE